jgi:hypothetical protein
MNEKVREALERAERWMGDCTELATIRAHIEGLEADAIRYRFLRDDPPNSLCVRIDREGCAAIYTDGDILDAAIDSAMQESRDG